MGLFQKPVNQLKSEKVRKSYNQVSRDYDSLNDVTSLGMHRIWKNKLAEEVKKGAYWKILDVCCGTGDMALLFGEQNPNAKITAIDFSDEMLKKAKYRQMKKNIHNVEFLRMDAGKMELHDGMFDCVVVSFGLSNAVNYEKIVKEMYRVLRPGGVFYCLDITQMENTAAQNALTLYRKEVIPAVSGFLAGNLKDYRNIAKENTKFLTRKQLASLLQKCGFEQVGCVAYTGGIAVCHRAKKSDAIY